MVDEVVQIMFPVLGTTLARHQVFKVRKTGQEIGQPSV